MRRRSRNNTKKERVVMVASSVFVLAALTMTGIYMRQNSQENQDDGYSIDFSALEDEAPDLNDIPELVVQSQDGSNLAGAEDALDYFPPLAEADSGDVKIPGLTLAEPKRLEEATGSDGTETAGRDKEKKPAQDADAQNQESLEQQTLADEAAMAADAAQEQAGDVQEQQASIQESAQSQVQSSFQPGDVLVWPVNGTVLIPYSMDRTVYFTTLQQYKYNPGMVISAAEGDMITAAASGMVKEVFTNEEIGNAVRIDMGGGYVATYGQLKDVQVAVGDAVQVGTLLGYVAAPTKYYSVEGCNAYFALTREGSPVDPLGALE